MPAAPSNFLARLRLACVLAMLVIAARQARSQTQAAGAVPTAPVPAASPSGSAYQPLGEGATVKVNFPSAPIQAIIPFYQELTGRKLILDSNLAGSPLRIVSPHLLTRRDAIAYIESTLLLNGYAFIHMDATTSKLINHAANANVPSSGLPVYNSISELPLTEEICHFVLPLQYVTATDASKAFSEVIKPHTYGAMFPVANDTALLITENSSAIRSIVRIAQIIDVPPMQTANETIKLQRADVEIVADIVNEIFEKDEEGADASAPPPATAPAAPAAAARPGMPAGTATPVSTATSTGGTNRGSGKPKVIPYRRTNELIVFARPVDITYIRGLVEKLDKQDDGDTFKKFRLSHLDVRDFLASARDTLARDTDIQNESGGASSGGGGRRGGRANQSVGRSGGEKADASRDAIGSGFANTPGGFGAGGGFGGGAGNGSTDRSLLDDPDIMGAPESIIVGKTLLIAHPQSNTLIVSGSPEHILRIDQLLTEMDVRPQQIYISAIIGQLNLGTEFNYGFDFLRLLDDFSMRDAAGTVTGGGAAGGTSSGVIQFPANFKEFAFNKLNFYGQIGSLGNYIKLIDGNRNFKVLATPSVYAKNASKAVIQSGQKIAVPAQILSNGAFVGGVASNSVSVEYRDVLLKLEVIPLINSDDEVTLKIAQINDNIVGTQNISGNTVPTIGTQELVTEVAVKNGAAVVLGGLITERVNDSARGGMFLRRIPIIKHLFGTTQKESTREELLIFIQPQIMKATDSLDGPNRIEQGRSNLYEEALNFSSPRLHDIPRALPYVEGRK